MHIIGLWYLFRATSTDSIAGDMNTHPQASNATFDLTTYLPAPGV